MIFCHKCGHKNSPQSKFCVNCGTELFGPSSTSPHGDVVKQTKSFLQRLFQWKNFIWLSPLILLAGSVLFLGYIQNKNEKICMNSIEGYIVRQASSQYIEEYKEKCAKELGNKDNKKYENVVHLLLASFFILLFALMLIILLHWGKSSRGAQIYTTVFVILVAFFAIVAPVFWVYLIILYFIFPNIFAKQSSIKDTSQKKNNLSSTNENNFPMNRCPSCALKNAPNAQICVECGTPMSQ